MIKRKPKPKVRKISKRKNPELESEVKKILSDFGENIKFKYLSKGSYAKTYYFVIKDSDYLKSGEYVIKYFVYPEDYMGKFEIEYLKKLSKYGLIPEIFYIDKKYIIMRYIRGVAFDSFLKTTSLGHTVSDKLSVDELNSILTKVAKLIKHWHKLGFSHNDLHDGNILITESGKIYLIDPKSDEMGRLHSPNRDIRFFKNLYYDINHNTPRLFIEHHLKELFP